RQIAVLDGLGGVVGNQAAAFTEREVDALWRHDFAVGAVEGRLAAAAGAPVLVVDLGAPRRGAETFGLPVDHCVPHFGRWRVDVPGDADFAGFAHGRFLLDQSRSGAPSGKKGR